MTEWYCDLTLDHSSVKLIMNRHLEFNDFDVPLPNGQNVLYVRLAPDGMKFAGVGNADDYCWEWAGGWTRHGMAFGPQSVIYDRDNGLHILGGPPSVGYRYVKPSNEIVTCDATRRHPTLPIWDWTELDNGVIIGQGGDQIGHGDDPVVAYFEGVLRLLQPGRCHFVNAYGSGNQACYACVREDTGQALTRWLTLDEIRNSPAVVEGPIEIPAVNRALWYGAYDRDHNGTFPSNCRIRWAEGQPAVLETLEGKDLAYYVAGNPDGDAAAIERACVEAQAFQPPLPVLAYVPHGVQFPPSADWIGLEGYQKTWETLPQFEQARRQRASEAARPVVLIGQCYTSNSNNTPNLRPLVPVFGRFLRDIANCNGFVAFSAGSWRATGYEDHPEVHPLYQELSTTITTPNGGGGGGTVPISIAIGDYAKKVSRKDPKGFLLPFDITSDERIEKVSLSMEGDGSAPIVFEFTEAPDGRYVRGMAFKPVVTGEWFPLVKAWDEDGQQATQRGPVKVKVTEDPINGEPPPPTGDLEDQLALVTDLRIQLFPDKFQPGHPDANEDGFLPLHNIERAALWAKHLAWNLKSLGVGMVTAKPGSANHGGANSISPGGFTTDIVALATGEHWDFQIDGAEGAAYPTWSKEDDPENYPPVADRWVPAFDPSTQ